MEVTTKQLQRAFIRHFGDEWDDVKAYCEAHGLQVITGGFEGFDLRVNDRWPMYTIAERDMAADDANGDTT